MNKLIVENRMNIPDWMALLAAADAIKQSGGCETSTGAYTFGGVTVHLTRNAIARTFIVIDTERVAA